VRNILRGDGFAVSKKTALVGHESMSLSNAPHFHAQGALGGAPADSDGGDLSQNCEYDATGVSDALSAESGY